MCGNSIEQGAGKCFRSLFSKTYIFGSGNSHAGVESLVESPKALHGKAKANVQTSG
jgi:ribosomal protein L24E